MARYILPEGYRPTRPFLVVRAPAGACPYKLTYDGRMPTIEDVEDWAGKVRDKMLTHGQWLTCEAIYYWLRVQLNSVFDCSKREQEYYRFVSLTLPDLTTA